MEHVDGEDETKLVYVQMPEGKLVGRVQSPIPNVLGRWHPSPFATMLQLIQRGDQAGYTNSALVGINGDVLRTVAVRYDCACLVSGNPLHVPVR